MHDSDCIVKMQLNPYFDDQFLILRSRDLKYAKPEFVTFSDAKHIIETTEFFGGGQ